MTKPSIAIVTPSFSPMIGGIENYVMGVGEELVSIGHKVRIYTPDSVFGTRIPIRREVVKGMEVHRLRVTFDLSYRIKLWPDLVGELKRSGCDIVHVYSHDSYALFALIAARERGMPMVTTTYGPLSTHAQYGIFQTGLFKAYDIVISPTVLKGSDLVMMRYPGIERWLQSIGIPREKMRLEPSGIPRASMELKSGSAFRERHGIDGPLVMYLGRVSPQKGVHFAIQAMQVVSSTFPTAHLMIIGPDYIGYSRQLKSLAARLGLSEKVLILPPMMDEDFQLEALAASDVFVMPSSFEGFSQSVMKAMAQGKPVVVTNVGGLPYEVGTGQCGLMCEFGNIKTLADGIIRFLEDPELARSTGLQGRRRASLFTFDALARNVSEEYSLLEA